MEILQIAFALVLEDDRCVYGGVQDGDARLNPGEEADLRLMVANASGSQDFTGVSATIEAITSGVTPAVSTVNFGNVGAGLTVSHLGLPMTLDLPLTMNCGDEIQFRITYTSSETGSLPPEIISLPVNGNPLNCLCEPVQLYFDRYAVENDACAFSVPPGSDGRINPGEVIELRLYAGNGSVSSDLTQVSAAVEARTPEVGLSSGVIDFGTLAVGQAAAHSGDPLVVDVPLSLGCGDDMVFQVTLSSNETGVLDPELIDVRVNGDPAQCRCVDMALSRIHRGIVSVFGTGWRASALPLTSVNDDESSAFPMPATVPSIYLDDLVPDTPLVFYRYLLPGDQPDAGTRLTVTTVPAGVEIHLDTN
ncbi:hypothetical protein ACFLU6_06760 [Acidobacteriota bacterium]